MILRPFLSPYSISENPAKSESERQSITINWLKTLFKLILCKTATVMLFPKMPTRPVKVRPRPSTQKMAESDGGLKLPLPLTEEALKQNSHKFSGSLLLSLNSIMM